MKIEFSEKKALCFIASGCKPSIKENSVSCIRIALTLDTGPEYAYKHAFLEYFAHF